MDTEQQEVQSLGYLAQWSGIPRDTLLKAAQQKRLNAYKSDKTWLSTRQAVKEFKARYTPKPRKSKGENDGREREAP